MKLATGDLPYNREIDVGYRRRRANRVYGRACRQEKAALLTRGTERGDDP